MRDPLHLEVLGKYVRIDCGAAEVRRHLAQVYRRLRIHAPAGRPWAAWRLVRAGRHDWRLRRGRQAPTRFNTPVEAAWQLEFEAVRCVLAAETRHLVFHAAGVEHNGVALILLGASEAGKTGAAVRLMARGARLLSDEWVAWRRADGAWIPIPRCPLWKAGAGPVPGGGKEDRTLLSQLDGRCYVPVPARMVARPGAYDIRLVHLVRAQGPLCREVLATQEALSLMVESCFNRQKIDSASWRAWLDWVAAQPVIQLTGGSLQDITRELGRILP